MKIKHFSGYGSVIVKKVSMKTFKNYTNKTYIKLVVDVEGNHERGLIPYDYYDIFNWLVKRYDKTADYYTNPISDVVETDLSYQDNNGMWIDKMRFEISYQSN